MKRRTDRCHGYRLGSGTHRSTAALAAFTTPKLEVRQAGAVTTFKLSQTSSERTRSRACASSCRPEPR